MTIASIKVELVLFRFIKRFHAAAYHSVQISLGDLPGETYYIEAIKTTIQYWLLTVGIAFTLTYLTNVMTLFIGICLASSFFSVYTLTTLEQKLSQRRRSEVEQTILHALRLLSLSLISGYPLRDAYRAFLNQFAHRSSIQYTFANAEILLQQGHSIEQVSEQLNQWINEVYLKQIGNLLTKYESAGSSLILMQIESLQNEIIKHQQMKLHKQLETGSLMSVLPSLLIFFNIMIILISPIFLGGLSL